MPKPDYLHTRNGRRIAFHRKDGAGVGVVFLGGFNSDMDGTKAVFLDDWAAKSGRPYLRFDYSGHGQSSGEFEDGCIGDWAEDAMAAITELTHGPQILVGSSMGGWISAIFLSKFPEKVAGFVGIAAAPDFTEDSMWSGFSEHDRATLAQTGRVLLPSDYGEPYVITRRLIEDGRNHLMLRAPVSAPFPVRLLQGTDDAEVEQSVALCLLDVLVGPDIALTLVKGADHRFSTPDCLAHIVNAIDQVTAAQ